MTTITILGVALAFLVRGPVDFAAQRSLAATFVTNDAGAPPRIPPAYPQRPSSPVARTDTEEWGPPLIQVYRVVNPIRCGMRVIPAPAPPPQNTRVEHADPSADPKFVVKHDACGPSRK